MTLPTPPTRVTAEANSSSQVFVQWQPPDGAPSGDLRYRAFYQQSGDSYYHSVIIIFLIFFSSNLHFFDVSSCQTMDLFEGESVEIFDSD